jgi:hypothetical protein
VSSWRASCQPEFNAIDLVMLVERCSFVDSVTLLDGCLKQAWPSK